MKINSGIIKLNKTEIKALELLVGHVRLDLSYRENGTFCTEYDEFDEKEADKVENAIFIINKLIEIN